MTALQAEWTKLRSVRSTLWALLAILGLTIAFGAVSASTSDPDTVDIRDVAVISLAGVYAAQIAAVALGVVALCGEYASGTIRATFMANPRRRQVLGAKAAIVGACLLAVCAVSAFAAFYMGRALLHAQDAVSLEGDTLRTVAIAAVYPVLLGLLSLGVAAIVRHTAVAVSAVLGVLFVPFIVGTLLPEHIGHAIEKASPMAGIAAQEQGAPISPGAGIAVTAAWAVGAMLVALWLIARRDA